MMTLSPHKFGRRVASLWQTLNRRATVAKKLIEHEAVQPTTRWQRRQCRELRREVAKLSARAYRQAGKLAE